MAHKKNSGLAMYTDPSGFSVKSHPSKAGAVAVTSSSSYAQKPASGVGKKGKGK